MISLFQILFHNEIPGPRLYAYGNLPKILRCAQDDGHNKGKSDFSELHVPGKFHNPGRSSKYVWFPVKLIVIPFRITILYNKRHYGT
jgi:hypothetical protein